MLIRPDKSFAKWINFIFKSLEYRDYISNIAKGTNIKNLKTEYITNYKIPLPPLEGQKEIIKILDEILEKENKISEILKMEEQINLLEKSILNTAFRGELGTGNINDVPTLEMLKESLLEK
ncbi:restriction endonuclease subunit S [Fusobacterium sp.]|uniref:restriction endonuclease subunit S n=1 Tax=Fusobacterium TaxID=848 RepID=UPI0025BF7AB3|nr:restriction endonuclease subunit S [Fusobacterium sp.]MCI5725868.1 restriction endonuclease subunit S [Fusobacterium sp.]MDY5795062.1 restriction endonuclease subunit S [Fusobacterium gastrosuis]